LPTVLADIANREESTLWV